jgi:hypothetical protein
VATAKNKEPLTIVETATHLRKHASVLMEMPIGEQFIGARDAVLHSALHQIADALVTLQQRIRTTESQS